MKKTNWRKIIKNYNKPDFKKSSWQLFSTLSLYVISWFVAYYAFQVSPWLCLGVATISQIFYGRIFIMMHDCGHGSFFKSKKAETFWGYILGITWFTPYSQWTKSHATHHKNSGSLEERGVGDIWTLTVQEYREASVIKKFFYRVCRFPIFVVMVGGLYTFFGIQRFFTKQDGRKEKVSVLITNSSILVLGILISNLTSFKFFVFYQFFLLYFGSCLAVLFFYVQHQYEETLWCEKNDWSYEAAAMEGSSYLKLPKLIQYASGNIGFHHIHHLSHSIPNYNLETAMKENSFFQNPTTLRLKDFGKCLSLALYDMKIKRLITFKEYAKNLKITRNLDVPEIV